MNHFAPLSSFSDDDDEDNACAERNTDSFHTPTTKATSDQDPSPSHRCPSPYRDALLSNASVEKDSASSHPCKNDLPTKANTSDIIYYRTEVVDFSSVGDEEAPVISSTIAKRERLSKRKNINLKSPPKIVRKLPKAAKKVIKLYNDDSDDISIEDSFDSPSGAWSNKKTKSNSLVSSSPSLKQKNMKVSSTIFLESSSSSSDSDSVVKVHCKIPLSVRRTSTYYNKYECDKTAMEQKAMFRQRSGILPEGIKPTHNSEEMWFTSKSLFDVRPSYFSRSLQYQASCAKIFQLCKGCSKNKYFCDELQMGRYCVQAVYEYCQNKRRDELTLEGAEEAFFKAYQRISQVLEWTESSDITRRYQSFYYKVPECLMRNSYLRGMAVIESMKKYICKITYESVAAGQLSLPDDEESLYQFYNDDSAVQNEVMIKAAMDRNANDYLSHRRIFVEKEEKEGDGTKDTATV